MAPKPRKTVQWQPVAKALPAADDGPPPQARQSAQVGDESAVAEPTSRADDDVQSVRSDGSTIRGDSVCTDSEAEEAAVAAASPADEGDETFEAVPKELRACRKERPLRDTAPKPSPMAAKWEARNAASHVGNIGWLFGNWGKRPASASMRQHWDNILKKHPAMIIGLAECEQQSEDVLRAPVDAVAASPPAAVAAPGGQADALEVGFENRQSYEYLTLRGDEECSLLIGVRKEVCNALDLLNWERRCEGQYTVRRAGIQRKVNAYSRGMVVRVSMDQSVGFLGKEHNIMVVHMHNHLANHKLGAEKLKAFWEWLWHKCSQLRVQVLMGDFNMCLFKVVPEFRSRGAEIDLAAWYPWKSLEGEPMSDSCGIFS